MSETTNKPTDGIVRYLQRAKTADISMSTPSIPSFLQVSSVSIVCLYGASVLTVLPARYGRLCFSRCLVRHYVNQSGIMVAVIWMHNLY